MIILILYNKIFPQPDSEKTRLIKEGCLIDISYPEARGV